MLTDKKLKEIQTRCDRLYLSSQHNALLCELLAHTVCHPDEKVLAYAYAHHAIMLADRQHMLKARRALREHELLSAQLQNPYPIDHQLDQFYLARIDVALGDIQAATTRLQAVKTQTEKDNITPQAWATMLAIEHGRPDLAPKFGPENVGDHIAHLTLAASNGDTNAGAAAMGAILKSLPSHGLGAERTIGNAPCPALAITYGEWLDEAFREWGSRTVWLAPDMRLELHDLAERLEIDIPSKPSPQDMAISTELAAGRHDRACAIYMQAALNNAQHRTLTPLDWQHRPIAPARNPKAAAQAALALINGPGLTAHHIKPWYDKVAAPAINRLADPAQKAKLHLLFVSNGCDYPRARVYAAQALLENKQYDRGLKELQPALQSPALNKRAAGLAHELSRQRIKSRLVVYKTKNSDK